MNNDDEQIRRILPQSDLDFNLMTTDPVWGSSFINPVLKEKLKKKYENEDERSSSAWDYLSFHTRDLRLANLDSKEVEFCNYMIALANDFLQVGMNDCFLKSISLTATTLELSQSKKGFLRKSMNTIRQEQYREEIEPKKKNLLGIGKKEGGT